LSPSTDTKEVVRRFFGALDGRDSGTLEDVLHPDVVMHSPGEDEAIRGKAQVIAFLEQTFVAFPDFSAHVLDMFAENGRVAVRFEASGTQTGEFLGIPPTGRAMKTHEIELISVADGKVREIWQEVNVLSMLQQLGIFPRKQPPRPVLKVMIAARRLGRRVRRG